MGGRFLKDNFVYLVVYYYLLRLFFEFLNIKLYKFLYFHSSKCLIKPSTEV